MRISDYLRRGEQIERSSALLAVNEMLVNNEPGSAVIERGREVKEGLPLLRLSLSVGGGSE